MVQSGPCVQQAEPPACQGIGPCLDASLGASGFVVRFGVMRSGAFVCVYMYMSGLLMWQDIRRGHVWNTQTGSNSGTRALKHPGSIWFSRSRIIDRLPLPVLRPDRISDRVSAHWPLSGRGRRSRAVALHFHHHCPGDARHPVGQCYRDQLLRSVALPSPRLPWEPIIIKIKSRNQFIDYIVYLPSLKRVFKKLPDMAACRRKM